MSPEQASGTAHRVDGRTDIYSLGVVLYEMLTGRVPFPSTDAIELLRQVREDEPQPPRQLVRDLPPELEAVCLKALAKRLSDRYTTADDFAGDGWQLAPLLREAMAEKKTVIIAISGYQTENDLMLSRHAGIDHHLPKPNYFDRLSMILKQVQLPS